MSPKLIVQLLVYLLCGLFEITDSLKENPLNGKSLRLITIPYFHLINVKRNSTGHVIYFDGILKHHLDHLGMMFNFSYYFLPNIPLMIDSLQPPFGGLYYFVENKADMALWPILGSSFRNKYADFPTPFNDDTSVGCIVAFPKEKLSFTASLKPLSYQVWALIGVSVIAISVYLRFSEFGISRWFSSNTISQSPPANDMGRQITNFVLGNLVSQGHNYSSTLLAVSIATGVWCAACFFLIQIYCSTLTSHLMSPNQKPIINSVNDLPYAIGVGMTAEKGPGVERILRDTSLGTRDLKLLAEKLKSDPKASCDATPECLKIVDEGHSAYCNALATLKTVVGRDLKTTGTCNYLIVKDTFLNTFVYTPLQKNSPYTEFISRGILILKQSGLYDQWTSWYVPLPWQCMKLPGNSGSLRRISISNLSSAFIILLIGYILSIVVFCFEKIIHSFSTRPTIVI